MGKKRRIIQTIADGAGNRYHIPPRKIRKFKHNLVMRFVIPGTIPSKKNCQIPSISKKRIQKLLKLGQPVTAEILKQVLDVKPYIRNSDRYKDWEEPVRADLVAQANRWKNTYAQKGLTFPILKATISIYHYWKDNAARDNSNKAESIHDSLVACGILSSDSHQCLYKNAAEADVYLGEITDHLTIFTITAHQW